MSFDISVAQQVQQMKPYSFKSLGYEMMLIRKWGIMCEGRVIREITGMDHEAVTHMVSLMNLCYQNGYISGFTAGQFEPAK